MLQENKYIFGKVNLLKWLNLGYNGAGIKIAICEDLVGDHYLITEKVVKECSSVDDVLVLPNNADSFQKCIDLGVKIITISMQTTFYKEALKKAYDAGITVMFAGGNHPENGLDEGATWDFTISDGAVYMMYGNGELKRQSYSAGGSQLDCVELIPFIPGNPTPFQPEGTSFSTPFVASMLRCYMQYYHEQTGQYLTPQQSAEFIKNNCIDLESKGFDNQTGYGLFCLPKELPKLERIPETVIIMKLNDVNYTVNGIPHVMDVAPHIENGRTVEPIRYVCEALGATVNWDPVTQEITITR